jgi:hypothetical protein
MRVIICFRGHPHQDYHYLLTLQFFNLSLHNSLSILWSCSLVQKQCSGVRCTLPDPSWRHLEESTYAPLYRLKVHRCHLGNHLLCLVPLHISCWCNELLRRGKEGYSSFYSSNGEQWAARLFVEHRLHGHHL